MLLLKQIEAYLIARQACALGDIANHFHLPPNAVDSALWQLEQLGKINRLSASCSTEDACSNCSVCDTESWESQWVEWIDRKPQLANAALHGVGVSFK